MSDTQEPVAWAAINDDGDIAWIGYTADAAADGSSGRAIVPLYRHPQPTLTAEERADLNVWLAECLRQCSTATEGGESDSAERWQGRARRAAAMIERLGDRGTRDAAEPSCADGGYPPVPPAYATAPERLVMARFLRVFDSSGGRFACGLVGTPAMDIRFLQEHPTREDADFSCYMLAKAIVFCGQQVRG